jgi:hypothetical protein
VPAAGHHDEGSPFDRVGDLAGVLGRRHPILLTHQNERRDLDARQIRPRIDPIHDGALLAQKDLGARRSLHAHDDLGEGRVVAAVTRYVPLPEQICDLVEATRVRERHQPLAVCTPFLGVGARGRIEERKARHPLGRLAHDLQSDVASHGEARERESGRRLGEQAPRDRRDRFVAGVIRDVNRPRTLEGRNLRPEELTGAIEPRHENEQFCHQTILL